MLVKIDRFQDIHLHASSVKEWKQIYNQITPGTLQSSLVQAVAGHLHIFREQINQRVVQHGEAPRGKICFALPLNVPGAARVQGREVDDKCIFVLRGGQEFMFHMPMSMDILAVTFDVEDFEQALTDSGRSDALRALLKQPVVKVSPHRLAESKARLLRLFYGSLVSPAADASGGHSEACIEGAMLDTMLNLIADPECDKNQNLGSSPCSFIVEKIHRLLLQDSGSPPSVQEFCDRLRVSRTTVQKSFQSVTQSTPVNYIRCIRLNGVRRELMSTSGSELSVGDAAAKWGFFHLSHFAADYRDLFDELPSQTARKNELLVTA